ncbi:HAMP domain-containing sensor histidine kinase, partial [Oceanospirillum sp. HFRX-1_2]
EKSLRIEQERFIDMISHEYRTPLSILKTNLEILELKEKPDWTGRHNLHVMQQASERLQEVFDKTIKGASWKQALAHRYEQKELVSLLDHFMDEAHVMWNSIRVSYTVNVRHAWYKSLDAALMKTVVFNLVDNARKYSSDPFGIQVSLIESENGDGLVFSVKNPVAGVVGKS